MSERMIERDEETQNWLRETRVNNIRGQVPPPGKLGPAECVTCDTDIPMKRREHGYEHCVYCAQRKEFNRG